MVDIVMRLREQGIEGFNDNLLAGLTSTPGTVDEQGCDISGVLDKIGG